jgi:hypothetical protein
VLTASRVTFVSRLLATSSFSRLIGIWVPPSAGKYLTPVAISHYGHSLQKIAAWVAMNTSHITTKAPAQAVEKA